MSKMQMNVSITEEDSHTTLITAIYSMSCIFLIASVSLPGIRDEIDIHVWECKWSQGITLLHLCLGTMCMFSANSCGCIRLVVFLSHQHALYTSFSIRVLSFVTWITDIYNYCREHIAWDNKGIALQFEAFKGMFPIVTCRWHICPNSKLTISLFE